MPADSAAAAPWKPPKPQETTGVAVTPVKHTVRPSWTAKDREAKAPAKVTWPAGGSTTVDLTDATARTVDGNRVADALPVRVRAASTPGAAARDAAGRDAVPVGQVKVEVADRAATARAGVSGLVAKVARTDGRQQAGAVEVDFDYSAFAGAYGGDWASRLRVISLADGKPLPGRNDLKSQTVSATVPLAATGTATTVALAAAASGDNGDYSATSLSPAATWQVSAQTGAFSWSYPLNDPPAMGGPEPGLALSYSSSAVDGLSAGTNTQGSWIGDGWELWPGFIERKFKACADDKKAIRGGDPNNKDIYGGDQCWYKPAGNATISLNGKATELVKSTGNTWKGVADDGSKTELLTDTSFGNGDADGEYWKVTTPDGTQYFFGRNRGQGGSSATTATNSTWTLPVYGNHPDEPGYAAGDFAGSRTTQAWRWNLDLVVDPQGNSMTYFYEKEGGAYGREGDKEKRTTYDRGGYLTRIEYGSRTDDSSTTRPAAQILFDTTDRCDSNCWSGTEPVTASWLDTPWDQYCKATPCTEQLSPTFWTAKRLSRIRSQVYSGSGTTYQDVEWVTLRHTYLQSGANEGRPMWLAGITRTGKVTTAGGAEVSDPEIVFDPGSEALANRVDGMADGRSNLFRYRITTITTETGAQISVTYSPTECTRSTLPTVHANTKRCYPQYYGPKGVEPVLDWFHKYRVDRVDVYDNTGGFSHEQTNYDYLDTPAWRYNDSELVDEEKRTWGEFRGYSKVRVRTGLESGVQSAREYLYFRGMDGDKQPTGTRDVWITDSQGTKVEDHEAYSGTIREETILLGAGGSWISGTITTPGQQGPTATSGPLKAWMTYTDTVRNRMKMANGSTRWTKTVTTVNADNLPIEVNDLGDEATPNDDTCTRIWYARNANTWMLGMPKKTETVGVNCSATPSLPADMLSARRTTYDADTNDWDTYLPIKGNVAKIEVIDSWEGANPIWVTVDRLKHDAVGRVTESTDALGRTSTTSYTPASGGPVTSITSTNPLRQSNTVTYATAWHLPTSVVDPNNSRADLAYDGLGRLTKAWLPGRSKATYPNGPSTEYTYLVRNTAPTAITAKTLMPVGTNTYATSVTLYDGLLRTRQVQTQAPGGGRTLTDTVYDSRGLLEWSSAPYYDTTNTPPNTTLYGGPGTPAIPALTENIYDGAGRLTNSIFKVGVDETTNEKWRTVTTYNGEKTSVLPPEGGIATTTITDARGRTIALRQYKDPADVGSDDPATFDASHYRYTDRGETSTVTDPAGNTWRYHYDQRGRKIKDEDPDRGITINTYDTAGQLATTTDAEENVLVYKYDDLGRTTSVHEGSITGPKRAEWTYDTLTNGIGKLTRSTRYEPAGSTNAYTNEITAYDTAGRPTSSSVTIPASEGGLCASGTLNPCTYSYTTTYRANGQVATAEQPAAAGLTKEKLAYTYNEVGLLNGILSPSQIYLYDATYNKQGRLSQQVTGAFGKRTVTTHIIDQHTGRLINTSATPELKPEIFNFEYSYDEVGNLKRIKDAPAGGTPDTQCYDYDYLRRLAHAWTPGSGDCTSTQRSVSNLGGPAKYWHSYTYYPGTDNRHTETYHSTTPTTRTYTYPAQGGTPGSRPHAVSAVETTGAATKTETFTYDDTGNTKTRPGPNGTQELTWDPEARLLRVVDDQGTTSYVYDADGNRLIRRDPAGSTLYLPGGTEVRQPTTGTATATRYYGGPAGGAIAIRTSTGSLDWIVSDHHGTAEATINNTTLTATRRRSYPFGGDRVAPPATWPAAMDKGFLGGTADNTGLTHLAAREYDPHLGKFISVDPIMDLADPQHWNGYAYSNNNPATFSDPSGLKACSDDNCRPGADYEDTNGDYVEQPGHNDGCNGCSKTDDPRSPKKPKTINDLLGTEVPGGIPDYVLATGYPHTDKVFTFGDAYEWAARDPAHFAYYCYHILGGSEADCEGASIAKAPNPQEALTVLLVMAAVVGGAICVSTGVLPCLAGAAAGAGEFAAGGSLVGGAGIGAVTGYRFFAGAAVAACSFSGETKVLMADGSTKALKDIKVGDIVEAFDPETGEQGGRVVSQVWVHEDQLQRLLVNGDILTTTEDHPFWNATDRAWQRADELARGDLLLTPAGVGVPAGGLQSIAFQADAYNLTVNDIHTYYVLAGNTPVLVHNTGPGGCGPTARFATDSRGATIDLQPLGRGSTGRTTANNLNEQLAMHSVMSNPMGGRIVPLKKGMTDSRWMGTDGWVKMTQRVNGVEIHYVMNRTTGQVDDYKFVG
ncbi:RHS repeat-associated core domain-containing protein [Micromonospora echinaurantiaca]|uniref:RHS repeat-associated core domain-containing protein n=1 Tax=Micromonospora echinaurantiaca TaxID=47857 RepID=UPI0037890E03